MKRRLFFSGYVHGVGFRWTAQRIARKNRVNGWVRNLLDGRVELFVDGNPFDIGRFLDELQAYFIGNIHAIDEADAQDIPSSDGFYILPSK